jgi:hypothetical protein
VERSNAGINRRYIMADLARMARFETSTSHTNAKMTRML